jgi:hypothetical protein
MLIALSSAALVRLSLPGLAIKFENGRRDDAPY